MPLFSRRKPVVPASEVDTHLSDDLALLSGAAQGDVQGDVQGDAGPWAARLDALAAQGRWTHHHLLVEHAARLEAERPGALAAWQGSGAPTARAVLAVRAAWEARSGARAADVSADQFAAFHSLLEEAGTVIGAALDADPRDPTAWAAAFHRARGLEQDATLFHQLLAGAEQASPHGYEWRVAAVEHVSPWWFGTAETSWDLAQHLARQAPGTRCELLPAAAASRAWWHEKTTVTKAMLTEALPQAFAHLDALAAGDDDVELVSAGSELAGRLAAAELDAEAVRALAPLGARLCSVSFGAWFHDPVAVHQALLQRRR
ncbi:hypothetical protein [Nocardioides sp. GY 10127]|uniref:hypothetical protein n=1 Tax=Nocardioides sp. GY 10127 TaxID=2569762 RepID=UPI0010A7C951|nr:hypothetical protein [Nocardioides sp. GY 10127]TIC81002.1 hypothetical protein E8D37_14360 [Nocardioides sp. GY 10127]